MDFDEVARSIRVYAAASASELESPDFDNLADDVLANYCGGDQPDILYRAGNAALYLGGMKEAEHALDLKISHVVFANSSTPCTQQGLCCHHYAVGKWKAKCPDRSIEQVAAFLEPVMTFMSDAFDAGCSVLVHCKAGAHRAPCIAVAFIMLKTGCTPAEAVLMAKDQRDQVDVNVLTNEHFAPLLDLWHQAILHQRL